MIYDVSSTQGGSFMGRADGKRIKDAGLEYIVAAHIMARRTDATNFITLDIPLEPMRKYINAKRKEGVRYSHQTVMFTSFVHTIARYPMLNNFVVNKRLYARNEIAFGMVVLKDGKIDEVGTTDKMIFPKDATIDEVNAIINSYIEKNRDQSDVNSTDKAANILCSVPGLLRFGVSVAKFMDKHNLLPKALIDISPFHATMMFTNLASIHTNHVYHHIYDFGTTSLTLAMGQPHDVAVMKKGEITIQRCIPLGLAMDERIASGSYFARAFQYTLHLLENPELLEQRPEITEDDI